MSVLRRQEQASQLQHAFSTPLRKVTGLFGQSRTRLEEGNGKCADDAIRLDISSDGTTYFNAEPIVFALV